VDLGPRRGNRRELTGVIPSVLSSTSRTQTLWAGIVAVRGISIAFASQSCTKGSYMRHKRVVVAEYGGPEVLTIVEEEIPVPKRGELRVKVLAAGVSLPDILAREGVHPETPRVPYTPGWDLIGIVDELGEGVAEFTPKQTVVAMPVHGCYAQYLCVSRRKLLAVPAGLDAAEAVAVVLNYITAYQMLHRSAKAKGGQRMLIHGASGGVGSAMLQLAKLAGVQMYGTCSAQSADVVREQGGIPIDYKNADFVKEIHRLTGDGLDAVFDGVGGENLWRSREALKQGGRVVTFGFQSKMRGGRMVARTKGRHPIRESAQLAWFIVRNWFKPGRRKMVPYSIQWLMRLKPEWFRQDLLLLLELLKQGKIRPLIAQRLPLEDARRAHEMLGAGGVIGKIVLLPNGDQTMLS
jgi:NADPH:quinone reductase-like Zn-dependent oxidoreductase